MMRFNRFVKVAAALFLALILCAGAASAEGGSSEFFGEWDPDPAPVAPTSVDGTVLSADGKQLTVTLLNPAGADGAQLIVAFYENGQMKLVDAKTVSAEATDYTVAAASGDWDRCAVFLAGAGDRVPLTGKSVFSRGGGTDAPGGGIELPFDDFQQGGEPQAPSGGTISLEPLPIPKNG